jgi:hypothetical protein
MLVRQPLHDRRDSERVEGRAARKDATKRHPEAAALAEDVDAEAAEAALRVGEVDLTLLLERVRLLVGHELHGGPFAVGRREGREVGLGEGAVDADVGRTPRLHVQVGRLLVDHVPEELVDVGHDPSFSIPSRSPKSFGRRAQPVPMPIGTPGGPVEPHFRLIGGREQGDG